MNPIDELTDVIRELHGADATHLKTVPIKETRLGQTIWEGDVEVFDLATHPEASRVYAWTQETSDPEHPREHITVLQTPPATTPLRAVQVVIGACSATKQNPKAKR
jgi:aminoglycoside phosphotransferase (APT) family kinase protein